MIRRALLLLGAMLLGGGPALAQSGQPFAGSCLTIGSTQICGSGTTITGLASLGITAPVVNTVPLTVSGYSLTGSSAVSLESLSGTINTSGSPDVVKWAFTDTARGATTKFFNIYGGASGTTSEFAISRDGNVGTSEFDGATFTVFVNQATAISRDTTNRVFNLTNGSVTLGGNFYLGFNSVTSAGSDQGNPGNNDLKLFRDAAGVLAQRVGTSSQISRIYHSWTDASNGSWAFLDPGTTTANLLSIGSRSNGTGAGYFTKFQIEVDGVSKLDFGVTTAAVWTSSLPWTYSNAAIKFTALGTDAAATDTTACILSDGTLTKGSGTLGICLGTSSLRFKNSVVPSRDGLSAIKRIHPIKFRYNKGFGDDGAREQYGFAAEQVIDALPGLVGLDVDGKPNSVDMVGMIPVLVKSIQELNNKLEDRR